jgi:hypothetical protein
MAEFIENVVAEALAVLFSNVSLLFPELLKAKNTNKTKLKIKALKIQSSLFS